MLPKQWEKKINKIGEIISIPKNAAQIEFLFLMAAPLLSTNSILWDDEMLTHM